MKNNRLLVWLLLNALVTITKAIINKNLSFIIRNSRNIEITKLQSCRWIIILISSMLWTYEKAIIKQHGRCHHILRLVMSHHLKHQKMKGSCKERGQWSRRYFLDGRFSYTIRKYNRKLTGGESKVSDEGPAMFLTFAPKPEYLWTLGILLSILSSVCIPPLYNPWIMTKISFGWSSQKPLKWWDDGQFSCTYILMTLRKFYWHLYTRDIYILCICKIIYRSRKASGAM